MNEKIKKALEEIKGKKPDLKKIEQLLEEAVKISKPKRVFKYVVRNR